MAPFVGDSHVWGREAKTHVTQHDDILHIQSFGGSSNREEEVHESVYESRWHSERSPYQIRPQQIYDGCYPGHALLTTVRNTLLFFLITLTVRSIAELQLAKCFAIDSVAYCSRHTFHVCLEGDTSFRLPVFLEAASH